MHYREGEVKRFKIQFKKIQEFNALGVDVNSMTLQQLSIYNFVQIKPKDQNEIKKKDQNQFVKYDNIAK